MTYEITWCENCCNDLDFPKITEHANIQRIIEDFLGISHPHTKKLCIACVEYDYGEPLTRKRVMQEVNKKKRKYQCLVDAECALKEGQQRKNLMNFLRSTKKFGRHGSQNGLQDSINVFFQH